MLITIFKLQKLRRRNIESAGTARVFIFSKRCVIIRISNNSEEWEMNVIVAGCGKVGLTVAAGLVEEGHSVTLIDDDMQILSESTNIYDAMGVCGNCTDCTVLQDAGVENAQLVIAATASDEMNMLCCYLAKKLGASHTIARIRNPEYNTKSLDFLKQELDLSMSINPEMLAAREMFNVLKVPSAVKVETFSEGNLEIIEVIINKDSPAEGKSLFELRNKLKATFLVCTVQRGEQLIIPDGHFVLKEGDKIGLTAPISQVQKLLKALGISKKKAKNIMILGGSRIAFYLTNMLIAAGNSVKLIERNRQKCTTLSQQLPKAVVINGDGAQQELLLEEGLESLDAFVTLTGMDEENILIAMFAAAHDVPTVIPKINRDELVKMAAKLNLDRCITPGKIVRDIVVQYARAIENSMGSNVETMYKLMDNQAEVLEFNVRKEFAYIDVPIKELKLKSHILIAGIIRKGKPIIPTGEDFIAKDDKVIIVVSGKRLNDLSDIMAN